MTEGADAETTPRRRRESGRHPAPTRSPAVVIGAVGVSSPGRDTSSTYLLVALVCRNSQKKARPCWPPPTSQLPGRRRGWRRPEGNGTARWPLRHDCPTAGRPCSRNKAGLDVADRSRRRRRYCAASCRDRSVPRSAPGLDYGRAPPPSHRRRSRPRRRGCRGHRAPREDPDSTCHAPSSGARGRAASAARDPSCRTFRYDR
jgi:hypothetical protein